MWLVGVCGRGRPWEKAQWEGEAVEFIVLDLPRRRAFSLSHSLYISLSFFLSLNFKLKPLDICDNYLTHCGWTLICQLYNGVPRGAVLAPTLFHLFLHGLPPPLARL